LDNYFSRPMNTKSKTKTDPTAKNLTPYQGDKRVYGHFCCTCGKKWESGNSWKDCYQKCKSCDKQVYPYKQTPLEKSTNTSDVNKPHPMELCQKCIQLRRYCKPRY
jgi:hypothetical protein